MISQKDLDTINAWFWGDNLYPEFESSEICWHCQRDEYIREFDDYSKSCIICNGIGLIEIMKPDKNVEAPPFRTYYESFGDVYLNINLNGK